MTVPSLNVPPVASFVFSSRVILWSSFFCFGRPSISVVGLRKRLVSSLIMIRTDSRSSSSKISFRPRFSSESEVRRRSRIPRTPVSSDAGITIQDILTQNFDYRVALHDFLASFRSCSNEILITLNISVRVCPQFPPVSSSFCQQHAPKVVVFTIKHYNNHRYMKRIWKD